MLSSLLRPAKGSRSKRETRSPFSSPFNTHSSPLGRRRNTLAERRRIGADFDDDDDDENDFDFEDIDDEEEEEEGDEDNIDEDEDDEELNGHAHSPLLPIFEASHLDSLPVYNLTHTIRLLVVPRCETTLSWDQLRSPQVSQFLVKPIQKDILDSHFSRATIYALMANYLQFSKEAETNPGNSGSSKTRAMVCELLAIKLLKEYSTRELIDALSYDFDPLQGDAARTAPPGPNWESARTKQAPRVARVSALEIAIRGQAKRLLAHPLVVQQLEAIWAGTIVFHSTNDSLHRRRTEYYVNQNRVYGAINTSGPTLQADQNRLQPSKQRDHAQPIEYVSRRMVTLYDPSEASLFKLSRLRVPRYRNFFSTCSLAVLLGLFTAVLSERSTHITTLEVIFWFWSAGFMLDEVVGFNEQGFGLYIMSFWNAFDLGILLVLACYYFLRIFGILTNDDNKRQIALLAYDVLAVNAVLLFPRLFSVLDHYRYFSQLLIAFRMMAMDLIAILILIVITCSGFFVAFSLGFGNDEFGSGNVVYALFQLLMGFTPAAWEQWDNYNVLGKAMLVLFLFITHFLVVTILITVLTNSFMAIVQNANDEHQFLFAVNTISMVKSDALFSYVAPTNIIAWLLTPLRFVIPMRNFVRMNRTVIKVTHFPLLFSIYIYERLILRITHYEPVEIIEQRGCRRKSIPALTLAGAGMFSPGNPRLRHERSHATFQKDRALDEVFRRPFRDETLRPSQKSQERRKTSNVVNNWMSTMGPEGRASPPAEDDQGLVERLERPRNKVLRSLSRRNQSHGRISSATKSIASDPEEFVASRPLDALNARRRAILEIPDSTDELPQQTDADGDDELVTNDGDATSVDRRAGSNKEKEEHYFQSTPPVNPRYRQPLQSANTTPSEHKASISFQDSPVRSAARGSPTKPRKPHHYRNLSASTMIFNPLPVAAVAVAAKRGHNRDFSTSTLKPLSPIVRTPKRQPTASRARPIMPPRNTFQSAPNLAGMIPIDSPNRRQKRSAMALDLASDLGDNKAVAGGLIGAVPASFATQMAWATGGMRGPGRAAERDDEQSRMSKLMLARMNQLEHGFKEVINELKEWKRPGSGTASLTASAGGSVVGSEIIGPTTFNRSRGAERGRGGRSGRGQERETADAERRQEEERAAQEVENEIESGDAETGVASSV